MEWRIAKLIVDDLVERGYKDTSGEMKALLALLLAKGTITEENVKNIISWGDYKEPEALKKLRGINARTR